VLEIVLPSGAKFGRVELLRDYVVVIGRSGSLPALPFLPIPTCTTFFRVRGINPSYGVVSIG
jgi:hypothetical protein